MKNNLFQIKAFLCIASALMIFVLFPEYAHAAASVVWDGGGGDNNWSTCENWKKDACPGPTDNALFNGTSVKDVVVDKPITLESLEIASGYTGTVDAGLVNITVGSFSISGGSFIAPSGTMTVIGNFVQSNSPSFNANGGTVLLNGDVPDSKNHVINAPNITFNLVQINKGSACGGGADVVIAANTTIPLGNDPTVTIDHSCAGGSLVNEGEINLGSGIATFDVDGGVINNGTISGNVTGFRTTGTKDPDFANNGTLDISKAKILDFAGSLTNGGSTTLIASDTDLTIFIGGGLVVQDTSTFPQNAYVTFNGPVSAVNTTLDAPGVDFDVVVIEKNSNGNGGATFTISAGTTVPLGNDPIIRLRDDADGGKLVNNGTIEAGKGLLDLDMTDNNSFFNYGTIILKSTEFAGNKINHGPNSTVILMGDGDSTAEKITITDFDTEFQNLVIDSSDGIDDMFVMEDTFKTLGDLSVSRGSFCLNGNDLETDGAFTMSNGSLLLTNGTETYISPDRAPGVLILTNGCGEPGTGGVQAGIMDAPEMPLWSVLMFIPILGAIASRGRLRLKYS